MLLTVLCTAQVNWETNGNLGVDPAIDMLGTTDNTPIPFRTDNIQRMRLWENGNQTINFGLLNESIRSAGDAPCGHEC